MRHFPHQLRDIDGFHDELAFSRVGQELIAQIGCTLGRLDDLTNALRGGCVVGQLVQCQVRIPENAGQDVVEVVSDTAPQEPETLEFLRLQHLDFELAMLLLRPALLGTIDKDAAQERRLIPAQDWKSIRLERVHFAP